MGAFSIKDCRGLKNPDFFLGFWKVRTGAQAVKEPGGRSWFRGHGGCSLLPFSVWVHQPALTEPRATRWRMGLPTVGWPGPPPQSPVKTLSSRLAYLQPDLMVPFSHLGLLLSDDSCLCQVDIEPASTRSFTFDYIFVHSSTTKYMKIQWQWKL